MKQLITILLILLLSSITYADDVFILGDSYSGNTDNKWKNRLEDDGHTVSNIASTLPSNVSSYEQIYDLRVKTSISTADSNKFKTVLSNGGTVFITADWPSWAGTSTITSIQSFIRDVTGDNSITLSTSIVVGCGGCNHSTTENRDIIDSYSTSNDFTVVYSGAMTDIGDNGKWLAKSSSNANHIIMALWDGDALTSSYSNGKVVIVMDNDYAWSSTYYTSANQAFLDAMINDVNEATINTRSSSNVSITSAQTTIRTAALNADRENGCNVCISQSGSNFTANIRQDGNANFIVDTDWSGNATVTGDNVTLNIKQGNVTTSGSSDENGLGLLINGNNTNLTVNQGDHASDQGEHKSIIDLNGNSNTINLTQYDGGTLSKHFAFIDVDALSNNLTVTQKDNGQKTIFLDINANSNTGTFIQEDTGLHYLDVTLGSASNTIDITQRGSGNHAARVDLDGYSTDFDLIQQGSSAQSYSIDNTCSNALGCTINNTQGTQ
jgi:hypothetical protein